MFPKIDDCYFYERKDNVLIANLTNGESLPLVRFKQTFPDKLILERSHIDYMEKYMTMYPHLWEKIEPENTQPQLSLF